jgi:ferritin-like metal-binding protein YciE
MPDFSRLHRLSNTMKSRATARFAPWVEELGLKKAVTLLESTLTEEKATDEALAEIAGSVVNQEAQAAAE